MSPEDALFLGFFSLPRPGLVESGNPLSSGRQARKVTYITEGVMRALHRQVSDQPSPYAVFGPYHTFKRADGAPLVPGEVTEITFDLIATSALIEAGHQIRVAIAGHDAGAFERIPAGGDPVITIQRNLDYPSFIDLPLMERGS